MISSRTISARVAALLLLNSCVMLCVSINAQKIKRSLRFKNENKILRYLLIPVGSDYIFDCEALGQEPIRYKWYKDGQPLLSRRTDSNSQINMPELRLRNLVRSDSGNYTCVAQNRWKNITANMVLYVQHRVRASPYIEKATMKNQTKFVGDNVSIVCYELITSTIPDFRWLKWTGPLNETLLTKILQQKSGVRALDDKVAKVIHGKFYRPTKKDATWPSGNGRSVVRGVEISLTNVTVEDSGFYTCIASNQIGEDYASMYLNVIERTTNLKFYEHKKPTTPKTIIVLAVLAALGFVTSIVLASLLATRRCYQHPPPQHPQHLPSLSISPADASHTLESNDDEQLLSSSNEV